MLDNEAMKLTGFLPVKSRLPFRRSNDFPLLNCTTFLRRRFLVGDLAARVAGMKTFASLREFENFLREHGVARAAAAKFAKHGWSSLKQEIEQNELKANLLATLSDAIDKLKGI